MSWVSTRVNAHKRFRLRLLSESPIESGSAGPRPRKRPLAKWCIDIGVRSERMTMGLLDDLKKQADLVKTQQILQQNLQGDKLKIVEDRMKQTFQYVHELLKQLGVVKPTSPLVYSIPGVTDFRNLSFAESFIDYRKKRISDKEYFDTVHFFIKWAGPDTYVTEKDMPPAMQRIREALWLSKIKFIEEEKKNPKGFVVGAKFIVPASVLTDVIFNA